LDPDLRREMRAFRFLFAEGIPAFLLTVRGPGTFEEDLETILRTPPDEVLTAASAFLVPVDFDMSDQVAVITEAMKTAKTDGESLDLAVTLFEDPSSFLNRLVAMLWNYWDEAFGTEWKRIQPTIEDSIELATTRMEESGPEGFFGAFKDQFRHDPRAGVLTFDRPFERDIDISDRGPMTIVPSVYTWPHVMVTVDEEDPPVMIYPVATLSSETLLEGPPPELVRVLRLLADDTRLSLLRLLAQQPRSTQELAVLSYLSEAAVSRHLKQLTDVGLLATRREGYYVLYEVVPQGLSPLSDALMGFIRS
jgi:DNA-binding transcriptional ArsR family regulator